MSPNNTKTTQRRHLFLRPLVKNNDMGGRVVVRDHASAMLLSVRASKIFVCAVTWNMQQYRNNLKDVGRNMIFLVPWILPSFSQIQGNYGVVV